MADSSSARDLIAILPSLLESGSLSDLTLICAGQRFKVHKLLLCIQSRVFRKLLDGKFKESGAAEVVLHEDEPRVLQVLLHFLYHFELDTTGRPTTSGLSTFLVHVSAIADKYDVSELRSLVVERLKYVCDPAEDPDGFVAVLRVTDACTADKAVWDVLLPKAKTSIALLLKNGSFRRLVSDIPTLALSLLDLLGGKPAHAQAKEGGRPTFPRYEFSKPT